MDIVALDFYQDPYEPDDHIRAGYRLRPDALGALRAAVDADGAGAQRGQLAAPATAPSRPGGCGCGAGRRSPRARTRCCTSSGGSRWAARRSSTRRCCRTAGPTPGSSAKCRELGRGVGLRAGASPAPGRAAEVALLADWHSWWALELDSQPSTALDQLAIALDHYRPLFEAGVACDVVPPQRDLSGYRLVVVPNLYLLTADDAAAAGRVRPRRRAAAGVVLLRHRRRRTTGCTPAAIRRRCGRCWGCGSRSSGRWTRGGRWRCGDGVRTATGGSVVGGRSTSKGPRRVAHFTDGDARRPARGDPARLRAGHGLVRRHPARCRADAGPAGRRRAAAGVAPVLPGCPRASRPPSARAPAGALSSCSTTGRGPSRSGCRRRCGMRWRRRTGRAGPGPGPSSGSRWAPGVWPC